MINDDTSDPGPIPVPGDDASTLPCDSAVSQQHKIGPYRLLERIGQGGMGEVYLAEQVTPIRRRVAIKLIKIGMDTHEVIARFESERQALAMMNHPNVARIYDAGSTEKGRPYFVMEYVPGEPITEYCDRNKLDLRARLELFMAVCQAIHHAHQKGIIHRDIKPSNVLVTIQDGRPTPKVIDFGVAKATQQSLTDKTIYTAQGRLIGTPAYMSPEQAEMTGLNIDTTSDVYSLGVLLYELLAGALPFDTKALMAAGVAEIHRIIREVDPPRPSTKISTLGERMTEIASRRRVEPRSWQRQLHGELDWITMRAMEKDRTRRYSSASEFAADIERFLAGDAVLAGPPSNSYRLRKTLARHRFEFVAVCAVVFALGLGLTVAVRYARSEARARQQSVRAEYLANFRLAQTAASLGDFGAAKRALSACNPEVRNWEWQYLKQRMDQSAGVAWADSVPDLGGYDAPIGVKWLGASNLAAIATWEAVQIVGSRAPFETRQLVEKKLMIKGISASADGRLLAILSYEAAEWRVTVIDVSRGTTRWDQQLPHGDSYIGIWFAPDGGSVVVASPTAVWCFNSAAGAPIGQFAFGERAVSSPDVYRAATTRTAEWCVTADDPLLICYAPEIDYIAIANVGNGHLRRSFEVECTGRDLGASTGRGDVAALVCRETARSRRPEESPSTIFVLDAATGDQIRIEWPGRPISVLTLAPDGKRLYAGLEDGRLVAWDARNGSILETMAGHTGGIRDLACDPTGSRLMSVSEDRTVQVWDVAELLTDPALQSPETATGLEIDQVDETVVVSYRGVPRAWALDTGVERPLRDAASLASTVWTVADGTFRICGARKIQYEIDMVFWGPGNGTSLHTEIMGPGGQREPRFRSSPPDSLPAIALQISRDGSCFVLSRSWNPIGDRWVEPRPPGLPQPHNWQLRSFENGAVIAQVDEAGPQVTALAISPDNRHVAAATWAGTVYVRDVRSGQRRRLDDTHYSPEISMTQGARVTHIAFSKSGRFLGVASADSSLSIWRTNDGTKLAHMRGHKGVVGALLIDEARDRVFSTSSDGTLRVWVLHDGSPVLIIEDERIQGYIHDIDIADDSGAVAVLTPTGALLIDPNRPFARVLR